MENSSSPTNLTRSPLTPYRLLPTLESYKIARMNLLSPLAVRMMKYLKVSARHLFPSLRLNGVRLNTGLGGLTPLGFQPKVLFL